MVKLFTHNLLCCAARNCTSKPEAYPLEFQNAQIETAEVTYNPQFIINMLPRIEWPALCQTVNKLGLDPLPVDKPEGLDADNEGDEEILQKLHRTLMETRVQEGEMKCPCCEHVYPIRSGIPNMLLPPHMV